MTVSLLKRMTSSFVDLCIVLIVVYGVFFVGGRELLRSNVDNYYTLNEDYTDVVASYNADISRLSTEYDAQIELANGDEALIEVADNDFNTKKAILNSQNTIDINPYNAPLTSYFSNVINFFMIGFLVLLAVLTLVTVGKTPGRRLLKIRLMTEVGKDKYENPGIFPVFLHDVVLKYFFIVLVFVYNMFYGIVFMLIAFIVDVVLITFTRNNSTIRDYFTKQKVVQDGYRY